MLVSNVSKHLIRVSMLNELNVAKIPFAQMSGSHSTFVCCFIIESDVTSVTKMASNDHQDPVAPTDPKLSNDADIQQSEVSLKQMLKHFYIEMYREKLDLEKRLSESKEEVYTKTVQDMLETGNPGGSGETKERLPVLNMDKIKDQLKLVDKQLEGQEMSLQKMIDSLENDIRSHRMEESFLM